MIFDVPPVASDDDDEDDTDIDDDGLTDSSEGTASVVTYGSAAAVQVGAADTDTVIGAVAADSSCLLYTSPSPRDRQKSRMPSSA